MAKKKLLLPAILISIICLLFGALFILYFEKEKVSKENSENIERIASLKIRNAAISDEHWRFKGINEKAIREAVFLYPSTETILRTIRRVENGTAVEMGVHGKTLPIAKYYDEESWQYIESARIVADEAVQFALSSENYEKFITKYLGPRYNVNPKWIKNTIHIYKQNTMEKKIKK